MDEEDVYTHMYVYTLEYYWAVKRSEMLPFAATWMDLGNITLKVK